MNNTITFIKEKREEVYVHNSFNKYNSHLSALSLDLFFLLLTQIDRIKDTDTNNIRTYTLTTQELKIILNRKYLRKNDLIKSQDELYTQSLDYNKTQKGIDPCPLFSVFEIKRSEIRIKLNTTIHYLYLNLKGNYFHFSSQDFYTLKNAYSKKIFLLAMQWMGNNISQIFHLKDLQTHLDSKYKELKKFRTEILTQAVKDININTSVSIKVRYAKSGNLIDKVQFILQEVRIVKEYDPEHHESADKSLQRWINEDDINKKGSIGDKEIDNWTKKKSPDIVTVEINEEYVLEAK